jgi:hypothetical protein
MTKKTDWHEADVALVVEQRLAGKTWVEISSKFPGATPNAIRKLFYRETRDKKSSKPVKILCLDIETSPILALVWGLWDQNISLEQIVKDWSILSYSAKWVGSKEVFYRDTRGQKDVRDDRKLLKELHALLDEADIVLHQNGKKFDIPKINARFILNGINPPSPFRHIDTLQIARAKFGFTSNKLQYMTSNLCTKYVKSGHKKFPGIMLWVECLKNNLEAFEEMQSYNTLDVLSLEELYTDHLRKWDSNLNLNVYNDDEYHTCSCGSTSFEKNGFNYSNLGKYQRYVCKSCGAHSQDRENLLDKDKRKSLRKNL